MLEKLSSPPPLFKGRGLECFGSETQGGLEKILEGYFLQKKVPLLKEGRLGKLM